ncbi:MAG: hypothetical protein AB1679_29775 [Actinomycetota bacterium]|jgi:hypothetical protein
MTPRVRVLRLRRRRILPWMLAAAVMALAWVLQLWLLVLLGVTGTIALLRFRRWHRRTALPAVVAGTAAARPPGATATIAVEEWAATWLAVTSGGHPERLRQAAQLVARREQDPWAAHVAITRLEGAETALRQGRILGLSPPRARITPRWRVALWTVLAAGLLALAHAHGTWWLLPCSGALAGAALSLTELEESRVAPRLLATEALTGPSRWDDREASALQLSLLAEGDRHVVRRARRLVETARWDIPHREAALRQLRIAEAMTNDTGLRPFLLPHNGLTWWKVP